MNARLFSALLSLLPAVTLVTVLAAPLTAQDSSASPADAWQRFESRLGTGLVPRRHGTDIEATGEVRVAAELEDLAAARRSASRVLLLAEEVLGVRAADLAETMALELAGTHVLQMEQLVEGVPVLGSRVELRMTREGNLTLLRASGLAPAELAESFVLRREEAGEIALLSVADADPSELWVGSTRRAIARDGRGGFRPAWRVEAFDPTRPQASWIVLVDAANGGTLDVAPAVLEGLSGAVDGRGMLFGPQTSGTPSVMPMSNLYVSAFDRDAALIRITSNACGDVQVAVSADGSTIAWTSDCDGDPEIWVASADGSGALQLTSNSFADHSPCLSGDGSQVVFVSDRDGDEEIYAVGSGGSGLAQLTSNGARDHSPSQSGDGSRAVYVTEADGDAEIATLLVAAPAPAQLTFNAVADSAPRLSMDGTRIVWVSRLGGDAEIFTMGVSGGSVEQVSVNAVDDLEPDVSPDGSRVVFASRLPVEGETSSDLGATRLDYPGDGTRARRYSFDLFEAAADGSVLERLTSSDSDEREPAYAADGGCIAYATNADGNFDIEVFDLASGFTLRITADTRPDRAPRVAASCGAGAWVANDGDSEIFAWDFSGAGAVATDITDELGLYAMPFEDGRTPSVSAALVGPHARVTDLDPRWSNLREEESVVTPTSSADLLFNPIGADEGPTGQVTAWAYTNFGHDVLQGILTRPPLSIGGPLPIDAPIKLRTQFPVALANAFYSPERDEATFFIGAGPSRPNTAYDSMILHEYGHFFDDQMGGIGPGSACEGPFSLSEGIGDCVALLVSGSPEIASDFYGAGTWLRNYDVFPWTAARGSKGRQYGCEDCLTSGGKSEPHDHGEAFAGFAWDLRTMVGAIAAEDLIFGALSANPSDMQAAVHDVFFLAATPAFGGTGDPTSSPYAGALYTAAARHGFDGPSRTDYGSIGCVVGHCGPMQAIHRNIGTEWLGTLVLRETGCEPMMSPEDDGVDLPATTLPEEAEVTISVTLTVNPALKDSGRYGAPTSHPQIPERRVYLNAWLLLADGVGGFEEEKILGTGSGSGILGPDSFEPGLDAVAFNPDTWAGDSYVFTFTITLPEVPFSTYAIMRFRVDHGEDAGRLSSCLSHPSLMEACGTARFGEVEDYQIAIIDG